MNTLEDRVRRALRETAEDISWTDVPPLRLPDRAGRGRLARGWRGWPPWLTPLAAAAAVAAVLAATLALTGGPARPGHRTSSDALLARVPRYYVALTDTGPQHGWPRQAEVRATRTGRTVATLAAPRPDDAFVMAAAASGVGRYVLAAEPMTLQHEKVTRPDGRTVPGTTVSIMSPTGPVSFYQLRISSSGQVSALSPLPVPALPADAVLDGLALTPDGRQLAVATRTGGPRPGPEIQVDTLATGAQRVWTWPGAQPVEESLGGTGSALSWAADDRTLAFARLIDGRYKVRLLDTTAPGSSLAASRLALTLNWSGTRQPPVQPRPGGQQQRHVRRPAHAGRQQDRRRHGHPVPAPADLGIRLHRILRADREGGRGARPLVVHPALATAGAGRAVDER